MTKNANHQKQEKVKNSKSDKSEKIKIIKKWQNQKMKNIKKVSKFIKNRENPFLGRKRKRRGSMRFGKNAPTRWLGKHVKWHLPPKVTYPPYFDTFSCCDHFLSFYIFHFYHFSTFCVLCIFWFWWFLWFSCFWLFHHFVTFNVIRPYSKLKEALFLTQEGEWCYVWWFSPLYG